VIDLQRLTVGVEEEYQIVDAQTGALRPRAERVLERATPRLGDNVQPELNLSQVEIGTPICETLADVREAVLRSRREVDGAAREAGSRIVALATHPFAEWIAQSTNPGDRYQHLEDVYQQLAREQLICGCHVHVSVPDPDLAVRVSTDIRPWLAPLLAITANSPYWEGVDTGYASYRSQIFSRWPAVGTPPRLESRTEMDSLVEKLVRAGGVADATFLYWDVRPSQRYPTVEIRIADVCSLVDDVVLLAALCRSLVRTHLRDLVDDARPVDRTPDEVHRVARWRAARFGLDGDLVDPIEGDQRPAREVIGRLRAHVRADLEDAGELDLVDELFDALLARGNGAARQRAALDRTGTLAGVVASAADDTVRAIEAARH